MRNQRLQYKKLNEKNKKIKKETLNDGILEFSEA